MTTPRPRRTPRWPWLIAGLLSTLAIATLEVRRARRLGSHAAARREEPGASAAVTWRSARRPWPVLRRGDGLVEVRGRVLDATTGRAIAGVEVVATDAVAESSELTEIDGSYRLVVRPGRYRLLVRGERVVTLGRRQRARLGGAPRPSQVAEVRAALAAELSLERDLAGVDLEVVAAAAIRGRVVGPDGAPLAGAIVAATAIDATGGDPVLATDVAETGADGTFRLVVPARAHQLEVTHPDFGAAARRPILDLEPGQEVAVELPMVVGCVITGTVVRAGQRVEAGSVERAGGVEAATNYIGVDHFTGGRFRWGTDELAPIYLRVSPFKSPPSPTQTIRCDLGARHDLTFVIPATAADLAGTLTTHDGAPASQVYLDVHGLDPGLTDQQERTDAGGAWEVFTLPPGRYAIVARAPGLGLAEAIVTAPAGELHLRMSGVGGLTGAARGLADGTFEVDVECEMVGTTWGRTSERFLVVVRGGRFRVDGLPACRLVVTPRRGPWRAPPVTVEITADSVATVDLDLAPLAVRDVRGYLRDDLGRPLAGATVAMTTAPFVGTETDATGRFWLRAPRGAPLVVRAPGHAPLDLQVPDEPDLVWDVAVTVPSSPAAPPAP